MIDLLGEAIGKENVITDNEQAQRIIDEYNGRVRPERISNKEVNKRFNEELQQQIDGTLPKDHTYQLGLAGSVLQSAGVRALPIELRASRLTDKSMQENHPFELSDIKNLPNAIQEPIMVFDSANTAGRKVILTEIESKGNNFVVVLSAELKGNKLEVNRIRSLYSKDSVRGIVDWINAGNLLKYADKNKALEWIGKQQSNSAEVTNTIKNLDVAA
ncbi:MAG: glycoside hydrolase family 68 protein, partial [Bacteroidales bacterium]|nr:glycoside hydrolase family 68 protein [Bacteroidales bacterium]